MFAYSVKEFDKSGNVTKKTTDRMVYTILSRSRYIDINKVIWITWLDTANSMNVGCPLKVFFSPSPDVFFPPKHAQPIKSALCVSSIAAIKGKTGYCDRETDESHPRVCATSRLKQGVGRWWRGGGECGTDSETINADSITLLSRQRVHVRVRLHFSVVFRPNCS